MSRHGIYDPKWGFIPDEDCPERPRNPQTNADRIRSMTDDDLAHFLAEVAQQAVGQYILIKGGMPQKWDYQCHHCWLDWLKQEAE